MATKIQIRRDLAAQWSGVDPVLSAGEFGYATDSGELKLGTGSSKWSELKVISDQDFDIDDYVTEIELETALLNYYTKGQSDGKYVHQTGGNITGDLTIGGDKITLDASEGSAEFAGVVDVSSTVKVINESTSPTAKLAIIGNANNNPNYGKYVFTPQKFWIGPDVNDANQAKIEFDVNNGTADFEGAIHANAFSAIDTSLLKKSANSITLPLVLENSSATANGQGVSLRFQQAESNVLADIRASYEGDTRTLRLMADTVVPSGVLLLEIEPDNDANYITTTEEYTETESYTGPLGNTLEREVTKTRDIRTYTGPTLDVKAVIQDLQQRVADRDAVIGNLVTRISNLEADHATLMGNNNGGY